MNAPALQIDFRRPARSAGRWVGWLALAVAVVVVVAFSSHYSEVARIHEVAQSRHERLTDRLHGSSLRRTAAPPDAQTLADVRRANAIIEQLVVPWDALFDAVESADLPGLAVLALTPNARDRSVRLAGEARSMDDLLAYADRLAAQPALSQVHLLGYRSVAREGVSVISFTMAATWR